MASYERCGPYHGRGTGSYHLNAGGLAMATTSPAVDFDALIVDEQDSFIANTGERIADIHPTVVSGQGHTAISNVKAFSGHNDALSTLGKSQDYMVLVERNQRLTLSLFGCRMRNYIADTPVGRT